MHEESTWSGLSARVVTCGTEAWSHKKKSSGVKPKKLGGHAKKEKGSDSDTQKF